MPRASRRCLYVLLPLLAACAHPPPQHGPTGLPEVRPDSPREIAVGVLDLRPAVVSGRQRPSWMGRFQLALGDPYDAFLPGDQPLAQAIGEALVSELSGPHQHYRLTPIPRSARRADAVRALLASGADRALLISIVDWESFTSVDTTVRYRLDAEVIDRDGSVLARHRLAGEDLYGGTHLAGPVTNSTAAYRSAFARLKGIARDPGIALALTIGDTRLLAGGAAPPAVAAPVAMPAATRPASQAASTASGTAGGVRPATEADVTCTVQQVLALKNRGMRDEDIIARCRHVR